MESINNGIRQNYNEQGSSDEISFVDIASKLWVGRRFVIKVTVIIFLLATGAFVVKKLISPRTYMVEFIYRGFSSSSSSSSKDKDKESDPINYIKQSGLDFESIYNTSPVNKEKYADMLLSIPMISEMYSKREISVDRIGAKRTFLATIFDVEDIKEKQTGNVEYSILKAHLPRSTSKEEANEVITGYLKILENATISSVHDVVNVNEGLIRTNWQKMKDDLLSLEGQMSKNIDLLSPEILRNESILKVLELKYPVMFAEYTNKGQLLLNYSSQLSAIEAVKNELNSKKAVDVISSVYLDSSSKSPLLIILGIGIGSFIFSVIGLFILGFIKEVKTTLNNKKI